MRPLGILGGLCWWVELFIYYIWSLGDDLPSNDLPDDDIPGDDLPDDGLPDDDLPGGESLAGGSGGVMRL